MHWAHLEASALGSLIAACPTWKRREERRDGVKGWLLLLLGVQGTSHLELISNNLSNTTAHLSPHHSLPHSPVTTGAVHIYSFTK